MQALIALLSLTALAQEESSERVPMELGLRFRGLAVPDGLVDTWAYSEDDPDEPAPSPRPEVRGTAFGLEYSLVEPNTLWTFYLERVNARIEDGYWDDVDEGSDIDHSDGYWISPSDDFGLWTLGVNTGRDFALTSNQKPVWLGLHLSGGLGVGLLTGELTQWVAFDSADVTVTDPTCGVDQPAYERTECADDGTVRVPKVLPLIDGNLGLKLNFPYGYVRFEGGLHDMLYWGVSGGGHF